MKVETRRIHISNKAKVWGEVEVVVVEVVSVEIPLNWIIMFAELS